MRKVVYSIFMVAVLFVCSMSLTSCEAITSQNITNTGSHGMNGGGMGGPGMNGGQRMNGNGRDNGNFMGRMASADLIGKIVFVDGNTMKIEVAKQNQNNKSSNSNVGEQDSNVNGNQSNNNNDNRRPPQGGFPGGKLELSYTGETKTITVTSDVKISERTGMPGKNGNDSSKSSTKVSDLKKGQVIMVWYKQNTKTVERISVM